MLLQQLLVRETVSPRAILTNLSLTCSSFRVVMVNVGQADHPPELHLLPLVVLEVAVAGPEDHGVAEAVALVAPVAGDAGQEVLQVQLLRPIMVELL